VNDAVVSLENYQAAAPTVWVSVPAKPQLVPRSSYLSHCS